MPKVRSPMRAILTLDAREQGECFGSRAARCRLQRRRKSGLNLRRPKAPRTSLRCHLRDGLEIDAVDSLRPGDVVVHSTDYAGTNAPWGELMSTVAKRNGAVGCVCDSQIRDCVKIIAMGFPVYYTGIRPLDSKGRGRVMDYDVPVRCGDVLVHPGELVVADYDGIVVVPRAVEEDVLRLAAERVEHARGFLRGHPGMANGIELHLFFSGAGST